MARTHIALALGAASLSLFLAFQLISVFGLPTVDYWHWKQSGAWQHVDGAQTHVFELKEAAAAAAAASGDQYLIGVGKADITG